MQHNVVPMRTSCVTGGPTLHHLNSVISCEIHHQKPQPAFFHILDDQSSYQPVTRQKKPPWFPMNIIGKPRGVWPTFVSFLGTHTFQGDGPPSLVYRHALANWDEPSPKERERAMGFQTGTTSHTKVTRLERNALLGRGMDLNSLTWLLVTCVLFQMYTTLALIQLAYNYGDGNTWHLDRIHLPIFNILHFTLSLRGRRYHVI